MTLRFEDLNAAVARNDVRAVVDCLRGATEGERKSVSSKIRALGKQNWDFEGARAAAAIAVLGTAGGVRQVSEVFSVVALGKWVPEAVAVLEERSPAWLAELPAALLTGREVMNNWPLVRSMVRAGLAPKPDLPEYTTQMLRALAPQVAGGELTGKTLEERLLDDPALLEDEVFRLFRVEGTAKALYWADSWLDRPPRFQVGKWHGMQSRADATWRSTLARLTRAGKIDFDRLLDECIGAFLRDFRPTQLGWYIGMHDELAPSIEEMAVRKDLYERLLAADASIGVGLGQKVLESLLRAGRLDPETLIQASAPALSRAEKGIVLKQLRLLDLALKSKPGLAGLAADVVSHAAGHERPEVQEALRTFLRRLPSGAPPEAIPEAQPGEDSNELGTELRQRATRLDRSAWAESIRSALRAVDSGEVPAAFPIPAGPGARLPDPIADPEELVAAFTTLIENARDPILLERVLAGAVRTARIPLAKRKQLAEPLAKRAAEQLPGWPSGLSGGDVRSMVASVAYTWATGTRVAADFTTGYRDFALMHSSIDEHFAPVTLTGVFAARCLEAMHLVGSATSTQLLSEPTHERGAIDAQTLVDRAQALYGRRLGPSPPRYDLEMAALRVRPADLTDRLGDFPRLLKGPLKEILEEMSRTPAPAVVAGKHAVESWRPNGDLVVLASVPALGREGSILRTLTYLDDPLATYTRLSADSEFSTAYGASIATWPLIAPWHPELIAAHLLRPLSRGLRPGKHDLSSSAVTCLMHSDAPLGAVGHLALALGCIGAEGDTRTVAADVFALASKDGRLQPALMAEAWIELARAGVFQTKRLEATLRPISAQPAAGIRLSQCLDLALAPLLQSGTKDMHVLLRVAASVATNQSAYLRDPAIAELARRKGNSELIGAARALVATQPSTGMRGNLDLVEGLIQRAER